MALVQTEKAALTDSNDVSSLASLQPFAETIFEDIRRLSFDGVGVTRESYGAGETKTIEYLKSVARTEEIPFEDDRAGNVIFRSRGTFSDTPAVLIGSHLDSVPQGGNFDGLAGVVAGLLCLIAQKRRGLRIPLRVIGFRGEESAWFGKAYVGSGAILGKLSPEDLELKHRMGDKTLREALREVNADIDAISDGDKLIDLSKITSYLELHIEQGPVMVARNLPLAVVSGIRGNVRHNQVRCIGGAGHSGAVPRWLRHDAMFAVADLIMRLDEHWRVLLERGIDLVVTTGVVTTDPSEHSVSRIPGNVVFSFEVRSQSHETLEAFYKLMQVECRSIEKERGVRFEFDRRLASAPATMADQIIQTISEACQRAGTPYEIMASGAGHDASMFANAGIPSGMLFIRNENGSHNPMEAMDVQDFMRGVEVLNDVVEAMS